MDGVRDNLSLEGLTPRGREEGAADGYAVEREVARRLNEAEKEQRQLYEEARLREVRQFEVTRGLSLISPGYAFQGTAEALLGTGLVRYKAFVKAAQEYLRGLRGYVRDLDAADRDSPHILFLPDYVSRQPSTTGTSPASVGCGSPSPAPWPAATCPSRSCWWRPPPPSSSVCGPSGALRWWTGTDRGESIEALMAEAGFSETECRPLDHEQGIVIGWKR